MTKLTPKEAIIKRGMTQVDAAREMNIYYGTLLKLLNGLQYWTPKLKERFCYHIGYPELDINFEKEKIPLNLDDIKPDLRVKAKLEELKNSKDKIPARLIAKQAGMHPSRLNEYVSIGCNIPKNKKKRLYKVLKLKEEK
jgi:hypothetical protein